MLHVRGTATIKSRLFRSSAKATQFPCPDFRFSGQSHAALWPPPMPSPVRMLGSREWSRVVFLRSRFAFHQTPVETRVCQIFEPPCPKRWCFRHSQLECPGAWPNLDNVSYCKPLAPCISPHRRAPETMMRCGPPASASRQGDIQAPLTCAAEPRPSTMLPVP